MIDVKKHAQDIMKDITTTEKKVLQVSTDRLKKAVAVAPKEMYVEGVDATRDIVNYSTKSQKKLGDTILKRIVKIEGVPAQAKTVSDKVQNLAQEILEAQQDLVDNVADTMVKLDPVKMPEMVKEVMANPGAQLKAVTDKVMDMDLLKKLTGKTPKQQAQAVKKTAKKTVTKTKTRAKKTVAKAKKTVKRKTA